MVFDWDFYYGEEVDPFDHDETEDIIYDENEIIARRNLSLEPEDYDDFPF